MADKEITVWQYLRKDWDIKKSDLKFRLDIDPNEPWENITIKDLNTLADWLDVQIGDIVD